MHKGISPSSDRTPMLVVLIWTPNRSLQHLMCIVSIGFCLGSFRQPQKSEAYSKMGLIRVRNRCKVMAMFLRNISPIRVFSAPYALRLQSRKSARALVRLKEGVSRNPRYLYSVAISTLSSPNMNFCLISRPPLLKII